MIDNDNRIQSKITVIIFSYLSILLIFLFWFFFSTLDMIINLIMVGLSIIAILTYLIINAADKNRTKPENLASFGLLIVFLFFFLIEIILNIIPNAQPFLFSFYSLIGLKHSFDIALFSFLSLIVLIKIMSIYLYVRLRPNTIEIGKGDEFFQYFTNDINKKKITFLLLLFPLSAFIEELIYRSLFLSFLIYYFNFNLVVGILLVSFIFGLVHYSSSRDSGYMLSLVISSIIYFVSLIELGLLYAWMFHLITNLSVLIFYYQTKKRKERILHLKKN